MKKGITALLVGLLLLILGIWLYGANSGEYVEDGYHHRCLNCGGYHELASKADRNGSGTYVLECGIVEEGDLVFLKGPSADNDDAFAMMALGIVLCIVGGGCTVYGLYAIAKTRKLNAA